MGEQDDRIDAANRHADPVVSWDALRDSGMSMDELMLPSEDGGECCDHCGLDAKKEEAAVRLETMDRLMVYLFADGRPEAWELVARRVYALAKCFFPHLLQMKGRDGELISMSLEKLSMVFDEPNTAAARATWSARISRLVTKPVQESGSHTKAGFQKSEQARAKMSLAQRGNRNRVGKVS